MRKTFILDTSILINDPNSFKTFENSDVILPIAVLDELDKLKKQMSAAGQSARVATRIIDDISNLGDISVGILLDNDVMFKIDTAMYPTSAFGDSLFGDPRILSCAVHYNKETPGEVTLVSNDLNLRIRARAEGIFAEGYDKDSAKTSDLHSGIKRIIDPESGEDLLKSGMIDPRCFAFDSELALNEYVLFTTDDGDEVALGRKVSPNKLKLVKRSYPWGISAKNKEQVCAIDLINDPNIPLVTLLGKAGTGKSLVALAAAIELVINKRQYDKFIIYRPIQPMGNDIDTPGPQPLDAKILTPNGWTTMGEIKPNDFVIGSDGKPKKVLKTFDKGKKEVFKVTFSDGSSTECSEDHLWYTTTIKEAKRKGSLGSNYGIGSVKSLKDIRESLTAYKSKKMNNHRIPIVKPVDFSYNENIIDPYIMGVLLGDGTLSEKYSVYFTSSDAQMATNCRTVLPSNMLCKVKNTVKNSTNYSFIMKNNINRNKRADNIFAHEVKRLGLLGKKSGTKFIPNEYKINSPEVRLSILQGLMDTDGFVSADGSDVSYSTTSKQLAEDVRFIVQSLGGTSGFSYKKSVHTYNGVEKIINSINVSVSLPKGMCPFRLDRKVNRFKSRKYDLKRIIHDVTSVGVKETKCILIESDDHLYVTDDFIVTHNTIEEKLTPWFQAILDNFEYLFTSSNGDKWRQNFDAVVRKDKIKMEALTYIRGRSIPNAIILIDEIQNLSKEEVKTILTRVGENTKIILTGDIEQIDKSSLDATNNGLTYVIEKFKDSELAGHITLTQGERSKLATKASEIL